MHNENFNLTNLGYKSEPLLSYNKIKTALSGLRYVDICNIQRDLGEKANLYKKPFFNIFDIISMNNNDMTRDMRQYQVFRDFKNNYDRHTIKGYIKKLEQEIETSEDKSEVWDKIHIKNLLQNFIDLDVVG